MGQTPPLDALDTLLWLPQKHCPHFAVGTPCLRSPPHKEGVVVLGREGKDELMDVVW